MRGERRNFCHVWGLQRHHIFEKHRLNVIRCGCACTVEAVGCSTEDTRLQVQHHAISLTYVARVQVDLVCHVFRSELLELPHLDLFYIKLALRLVFSRLVLCQLLFCHVRLIKRYARVVIKWTLIRVGGGLSWLIVLVFFHVIVQLLGHLFQLVQFGWVLGILHDYFLAMQDNTRVTRLGHPLVTIHRFLVCLVH